MSSPFPGIPSFQQAADGIRSRFFALLGSTQGFPYNPNLRTSFNAQVSIVENGQPASGIFVEVDLVTQQADGSLIKVATGTGTTDSTGTVRLVGKGAYYLSGSYFFAAYIGITPATTIFRLSAPVSGSLAYQLGFNATYHVGTLIEYVGSITVNGSPAPAGVTVEGHFEQVDPGGNIVATLDGSTTTDANGNYDLKISALYSADAVAQSAFSYLLQVAWGVTNGIPNLVAWTGGSINGATLVQGAQRWDVQLKKDTTGKISGPGSDRPPPPPHHQKTP